MNAVMHCPASCLKWKDFPPLLCFSVGGLPATAVGSQSFLEMGLRENPASLDITGPACND